MSKFNTKAILSAKDSITNGGKSVKSATDKLTKIANEMMENESAPDPAQVKEIVESIAEVAEEIVQNADSVAKGLETVVGEEVVEGGDDEPPIVESTMTEQEKEKMAALEEETEELKKFKEKSEKEKMASEYANLFDPQLKQAKFEEFMKMDKPNSELKTVLSATENVLKSVQKTASMGKIKTNETIIFKESSNQKTASMGSGPGNAKTLTEI